MDSAGLAIYWIRSVLNTPSITSYVPLSRIVQDVAPTDMALPVVLVIIRGGTVRGTAGSPRNGERYSIEVTVASDADDELNARAIARRMDELLDVSGRAAPIAGQGYVSSCRAIQPVSRTELDDTTNKRVRRVGMLYEVCVVMDGDDAR
jgi:hypothetical protein